MLCCSSIFTMLFFQLDISIMQKILVEQENILRSGEKIAKIQILRKRIKKQMDMNEEYNINGWIVFDKRYKNIKLKNDDVYEKQIKDLICPSPQYTTKHLKGNRTRNIYLGMKRKMPKKWIKQICKGFEPSRHNCKRCDQIHNFVKIKHNMKHYVYTGLELYFLYITVHCIKMNKLPWIKPNTSTIIIE